MTKVGPIEACGQEACTECEIPHLIDAKAFPTRNGSENSEYGRQSKPHEYQYRR